MSRSSPPSAKRTAHRLLGPFLPGGEIAQAPGAHQMHPHDEPAVLGGKQEVLAAATAAGEALPLERARGRIERLQRRDVTGPRGLDGRARHERVELTHPCLDFG